MKRILLIAAILLSGCASMSETDKMWHIANAIDVGQTYQLTKSHCHYESDPITSSLIGEKPGAMEVAAWGMASAAIYEVAKPYLPKWAKSGHVILRFGIVESNYANGVSPTGFHCSENWKHQNSERISHAAR